MEIELLLSLKRNLVNFFDELMETFPNISDFVLYRVSVKDRTPIVLIMDYITKELCPSFALVKAKNDSFFLEKNTLWDPIQQYESKPYLIPADNNIFKTMFSFNYRLDKDDKDTIFAWYELFLDIGNRYLEQKKSK